MNLSIAAYFGIRDARMDAIVENLLSEMMPDGAWNCRRLRKPKPHHSSFHTTFNVLEGLREWLETTPKHALRNDVLDAEESALELMVVAAQHRMQPTRFARRSRASDAHVGQLPVQEAL
jgi:hypothetical protein